MKKAPKKQISQRASSKRPLPKTFRGATVVRAKGMGSDAFERLLERSAIMEFDATGDIFIVLPDKALEDLDGSSEVRGFYDEKIAIRCAQAMGNGNVDHRVLRVTQQTLVVGTMNEL